MKQHSAQVLIVHGDGDRLVPLRNSRRLAKLLGSAQLEIVPNCGHCPQEEHPEHFAALVQRFLAQ